MHYENLQVLMATKNHNFHNCLCQAENKEINKNDMIDSIMYHFQSGNPPLRLNVQEEKVVKDSNQSHMGSYGGQKSYQSFHHPTFVTTKKSAP